MFQKVNSKVLIFFFFVFGEWHKHTHYTHTLHLLHCHFTNPVLPRCCLSVFPLTLFHLYKFLLSFLLSLRLPPSPPPSPLPSSPLAVKVILIKSSHRRELLIAPGRTCWFQIQIKAQCFSSTLPSSLALLSSPSPPHPPHLCSTMANTIWILDMWTVTARPSPLLPPQDRGRKWGQTGHLFVFFCFFHLQDDFLN